jgi:hypothetical protein
MNLAQMVEIVGPSSMNLRDCLSIQDKKRFFYIVLNLMQLSIVGKIIPIHTI